MVWVLAQSKGLRTRRSTVPAQAFLLFSWLGEGHPRYGGQFTQSTNSNVNLIQKRYHRSIQNVCLSGHCPRSGWHIKLTIIKPFLPVTSWTRCQFSSNKTWSLSFLTSARSRHRDPQLFLTVARGFCLRALHSFSSCLRCFFSCSPACPWLMAFFLSLCSEVSHPQWGFLWPLYLRISAACLVFPLPLPCFISSHSPVSVSSILPYLAGSTPQLEGKLCEARAA